ncbi:hypothetical protein IP90_02923 [Luteimonas cucumeris]|uniref:Uncharacterized protein n=1 Tax=Luteimonas cucumeris TaxID=985012 RepID=A0A562KX35_9GAMM|nr:hypothetical protein IP90_02923 [Luteimonas cucumeris]
MRTQPGIHRFLCNPRSSGCRLQTVERSGRAAAFAVALQPRRHADPKGGGHGWPPFSDRASMASRKIPANHHVQTLALIGEDPFLWLLSFGSAKESDPHAAARGKADPRGSGTCVVASNRLPGVCRPFRSGFRLLSQSGHFLLMGPRESNQREGPSPTNQSGQWDSGSRFSESASCLHRKTAAIHGRRPTGLGSYAAEKQKQQISKHIFSALCFSKRRVKRKPQDACVHSSHSDCS